MDNSTGDKISLRKATTDEVAYLKVKAAKRDNEMRKKVRAFLCVCAFGGSGFDFV